MRKILMEPKITGCFMPTGVYKVEVEGSPHPSVRRVFGEREIVDRIGDYYVTIHLQRGREMAFPLPESEGLAVLRPLASMTLARKRVMIEWSFCDQEGIYPVTSFSLVQHNPEEHVADTMFNVIFNRDGSLGWVTLISLKGITSEGTEKEGYIFEIPKEGYALSHRNRKALAFRMVDGKCVEDGYLEFKKTPSK